MQTPNSLFISRNYHLFIPHFRSTVYDEILGKVLVCELLVFRVSGIKSFCLIRGISVVTNAIQVFNFILSALSIIYKSGSRMPLQYLGT